MAASSPSSTAWERRPSPTFAGSGCTTSRRSPARTRSSSMSASAGRPGCARIRACSTSSAARWPRRAIPTCRPRSADGGGGRGCARCSGRGRPRLPGPRAGARDDGEEGTTRNSPHGWRLFPHRFRLTTHLYGASTYPLIGPQPLHRFGAPSAMDRERRVTDTGPPPATPGQARVTPQTASAAPAMVPSTVREKSGPKDSSARDGIANGSSVSATRARKQDGFGCTTRHAARGLVLLPRCRTRPRDIIPSLFPHLLPRPRTSRSRA